jgi:hypothetical protein
MKRYQGFGAGAIVAAGLFGFGSAAQAEPVSVYTDFSVNDACREIETNEVGGTWTCPGYGDYPVLYSQGDARDSIFYGHVGPWYSDKAWQSFGPFNSAGEKIEWRLEKTGGTPVAAIQRWTVGGGDSGPQTSVLVVSKVGLPDTGEACVTGYVDATLNKDANTLARQVADTLAPQFKCRVDQAKWHGVTGPNTPQAQVEYGP